jgi:hypothetical protein
MPLNVEKLIESICGNSSVFAENHELRENCKDFVSLSLAKNTWKRYGSALKLLDRFCNCKKGGKAWDEVEKREFICWAGKNTKLKPQTISMYFSAINKVYSLLGNQKKDGGENLRKIVFKGLKHMKAGKGKERKIAKIFNPVNLRILDKVRPVLQKRDVTDRVCGGLV